MSRVPGQGLAEAGATRGEDQATAAYNVIRLFRTIFGGRMNDLLHPATTIGYHFGAWLNDADVALFQGSVQPEKNQPRNEQT